MNDCLKRNLEKVCTNIDCCANTCGRNRQDIKLVVVTKTVPVELINELFDLGIRDIGENRIKEAKSKVFRLEHPYNIHLIGHLQTNKVKAALGLASAIHSVDSLRLATAINECAANLDKSIDVFLEVNVSGEATKYGLRPEDVEDMASKIDAMNNLVLKGLMTMAPYTNDKKILRKTFSCLRNIKEKYNSKWLLSMGMSNDYCEAIKEGADILRIGSAIFDGVA